MPGSRINYSFPVSDIKRTLDAMSWVKVSFLCLSSYINNII